MKKTFSLLLVAALMVTTLVGLGIPSSAAVNNSAWSAEDGYAALNPLGYVSDQNGVAIKEQEGQPFANAAILITKSDDTTEWLGWQPVYDTDDPTKIVGTTGEGATGAKTLTVGTGSVAWDPATGILTLTDATVKKNQYL